VSRHQTASSTLSLVPLALATLALSALDDVDVDSNRSIEVNLTNAHLEAAVVVAANDLCVTNFRVGACLNTVTVSGTAELGSRGAGVALLIVWRARRTVFASLLGRCRRPPKCRQPGQWEISNSWSSGYNIASLNFNGRFSERSRESTLEHSDTDEKSGKLHIDSDSRDC
jgi:hypothetical protein